MSRTLSRLVFKPWQALNSSSLQSASCRPFTALHRQRQTETTSPLYPPEPTSNATTFGRDRSNSPEKQRNIDFLDGVVGLVPYELPRGPVEPYHLHCYSTKHNTHITLTNSKREPLISTSCGNLGFRKGARGTYEAAFQTSAWVMRKMLEKGCFEENNDNYITKLEVITRGWTEGRQAFVQALMGIEGRLIRPKVMKVSDATRIKFGGTRSPNPRRLG